MQIRYQNVQKNITYMLVSFAFMKKVLESAHPSFSSYDNTMNSKIKKIIKKMWWQRMTNVLSACQVSSRNNIRGCRGKKQSALQNRLFFCHNFHECRSLMKLGEHLEHLSFFATIFFFEFF